MKEEMGFWKTGERYEIEVADKKTRRYLCWIEDHGIVVKTQPSDSRLSFINWSMIKRASQL